MKRILLVLCSIGITGCMVGPKYSRPTPLPVPPAFKEEPPEAFKEWKPAQPADATLREKWWEIFGDPELNALEEKVEVSNQNLIAAEARLRSAREQIVFNRAAEFPTIGVQPFAGGQGLSGNRPGFNIPPVNSGSFQIPFQLSWEMDLWGRIRRSVEASRDFAQASAADVVTAKLSFQAELALDYFEVRSADAQSRILEDTVRAFRDAVDLTRNRFQGGIAPQTDLAQAETQLESAQVLATDVKLGRAQREHAIAILIGVPPSSFSLAPLTEALNPPPIPVGLPSELLERRPDVATSERLVAAANERIGIAQAAFYPTVVLGASGGLQGTSLLNLFDWPSRVWGIGATATQILYDKGRRRAVAESALADYDQVVANYRQTALQAFQQVEDNLAALRILETEAQNQERAAAAANQSLTLAETRYRGGVDTYLLVLTAQTIALNNQRNVVDIQRRRMLASVLLIKALGGGWNVTSLPSMANVR